MPRPLFPQFRPKYPVFQHFFDRSFCFAEDFRDQFPDFARLSCIENSLSENMGRILEGLKGFPAPPIGGGGVLSSFRPFFGLAFGLSVPLSLSCSSPVGLSSFGLRSSVLWANFQPFPLGIFKRGANMPVFARFRGLWCGFVSSVWIWLGAIVFGACGA